MERQFDLLKMKEMSLKLTPQYLAGFFDGEGHVACTMVRGSQPAIRVGVGQTNAEIILAIALKFDGHFKHVPVLEGRKPFFDVTWHGKYALPFLLYIKDHVILKKPQVDLGIEFIGFIVGNGEANSRDPGYVRRLDIVKSISTINSPNKTGEKDGVQ